MFIQVSTSAQNVANVVKTAINWQYTGDVIQERNHLNVLLVANDLKGHMHLLDTAEFTVEKNHTNVTCVTRCLVCLTSKQSHESPHGRQTIHVFTVKTAVYWQYTASDLKSHQLVHTDVKSFGCILCNKFQA